MRKYEEYYLRQEQLAKKVLKENKLPPNIKYIAGTDVSYKDSIDMMVGAFVVLDAQTLEVVDKAYHQMHITFPYISGLFSFREVPPLLEAYKKLKIKPDLIICDAQGLAHPRHFGMACHLGLELDLPTIGCAKTRLIGEYEKDKLGIDKGSQQDLIYKGEVVGKILRTRKNTNPLFVSIGHKIDLETAIEWVLKMSPKYRLPETTRHADKLVGELMQINIANIKENSLS